MTNEEKAQEISEKNAHYHIASSSLDCYISALEMAEWKDSQPISAETFKACIQMLNETCYEDGTGVEDTEIEFTIKQKKLR